MSFIEIGFAGVSDYFYPLNPSEPSEPIRPFPSVPQPF